MLEPGRRRDALETAVARAVRRFGPRIYLFDIAAAEAAARTLRVARTAGLGIHQIPDKLAYLQTAGIAIAHGLQLATHNIDDFQGLGLDLIDPWASNKRSVVGDHLFLQPAHRCRRQLRSRSRHGWATSTWEQISTRLPGTDPMYLVQVVGFEPPTLLTRSQCCVGGPPAVAEASSEPPSTRISQGDSLDGSIDQYGTIRTTDLRSTVCVKLLILLWSVGNRFPTQYGSPALHVRIHSTNGTPEGASERLNRSKPCLLTQTGNGA